jgi:hypothetical protein
MESKTEQLRRHRGVILQLVYVNHEEQGTNIDDVQLWALLSDLGYGVGQNYVLARLQSLSDRGYLKFTTQRNRITGRVAHSRIELTAAGRDLVERIKEDPAVLIP